MARRAMIRVLALALLVDIGCTKGAPAPASGVETLFPVDPAVLGHFLAVDSAARRLEADELSDPTLDARLQAQLEAALTAEDAGILLRLADSLADPGVVSGTSAWTPPADLPVLLGHLRALPYFDEALAGLPTAGGTSQARAKVGPAVTRAVVTWPLTDCQASCQDYATKVYRTSVAEQTAGLVALLKFKDINPAVKCLTDLAKCDLADSACDKEATARKVWTCSVAETAKALGSTIASSLYKWIFRTLDMVFLFAEAQAAARDGMLACLDFQGGDGCCTPANDKVRCGSGTTAVCLTRTALNVAVKHCGACDNACDSPPPVACDTATSRVEYTSPSRCLLGTCAYHEVRKSCDAPPAAYCVNGTQLVAYAVPGDCHAATGECRYTQQVEFCNNEGLACVASAMGATCGNGCTGPSDCTGGRECQGGVCACPAGAVACNGTCIPTSACCTDTDCTGGTICMSGVCCRAGMKACAGGCLAAALCCTDADCGTGGTCQADGTCQRPTHWAGTYKAATWTANPADKVGVWYWEVPGRTQGPVAFSDVGFFYFSDASPDVVLGSSLPGPSQIEQIRRVFSLGWKSTDTSFRYSIPIAFAQSTGQEVVGATGTRTVTFTVTSRGPASLGGTFEVATSSGYTADLGLSSSSWRTVSTTASGTWSATRVNGPGPQTKMNGFDFCMLSNAAWSQVDMALVTKGCNAAFTPGFCGNPVENGCTYN